MTDISNSIAVHNSNAEEYDCQVKQFNSHIHDVLFGMSYEYINKTGNLLDIGIGTGLSSILFSKAGMNVYGIDGSKAMLDECCKKYFAKELTEHNLQNMPLPYTDSMFDFVISCGVLHFFGDISSLFKEMGRVLKENGYLAFTIALSENEEVITPAIISNKFIKLQTEWGISIFKHSDHSINELALQNGFKILKQQKLLQPGNIKNSADSVFKVIIMQKKLKLK